MARELAETFPQFDTLALTAVRQDSKDLKWHATPLLASLRENRGLFQGQEGKPWKKEEAGFQKSATTMEYIRTCGNEGKNYSRVKANLIVALERRMGKSLSMEEVGKLGEVTSAIEDLAIRTRLSPADRTGTDHAPWADLNVDHNLFVEVCLSQMKIEDKNPDPEITAVARKVIVGEFHAQDRPPPPPPAPNPVVEIPPPSFMTNALPVTRKKDNNSFPSILGTLRHGEKTIVPLMEKGVRFTLPPYPDGVLIGREREQPPNKDFKFLALIGAGDEMSREHVAIAWMKEDGEKPAFLTFSMKDGEYAPVAIVEKVGEKYHMKLLHPKKGYLSVYDVYSASGDINNIFLILPDQVDSGSPRRAVIINFQRQQKIDSLIVEVKADSKIAPSLYEKALKAGKKLKPQRTKDIS